MALWYGVLTPKTFPTQTAACTCAESSRSFLLTLKRSGYGYIMFVSRNGRPGGSSGNGINLSENVQAHTHTHTRIWKRITTGIWERERKGREGGEREVKAFEGCVALAIEGTSRAGQLWRCNGALLGNNIACRTFRYPPRRRRRCRHRFPPPTTLPPSLAVLFLSVNIFVLRKHTLPDPRISHHRSSFS